MHVLFMCILFIYVSIPLAFNKGGLIMSAEAAVTLNKQNHNNTKYKNGKKTDIKEAIDFMQKINAIDLRISNKVMETSFSYDTNLTKYNKEVQDRSFRKMTIFYEKSKIEALKFDWKSFKDKNATLYRWFKLYLGVPLFHKPYISRTSNRKGKKKPTMNDIFNNARVCPYNNTEKEKCSLHLYPDVVNIMSKSRNPIELKSIWKQFRDATGKKSRKLFVQSIKDSNEYAVMNGFIDYEHQLVNDYESKYFVENMTNIVKDIMPLYQHFHAYIRRKLIQHYGGVEILDDGPIPAHLLGDLYAQTWFEIFDIVNPFPNRSSPNVTEALLKKKMKPLDLFVMADNFFASIGLERMTPYFWARSVLEKPNDRKMICNAAAMDFYNGKDFRIRQCTEVDEKSFKTVYHEMGHVEYYMLYKDLPKVFRAGANNGFHEAVGDAITLSVTTTDYLKKVSLIKDDFEEDEELDIIHLFKVALNYLPMIPYAYIMDHYRYQVYNGSIKTNNLNRYWWIDRLDYQGVCPPVRRTETDFDAGAKFHVANSIEYMRYFFATVFTFQIHKSLCQRINHQGPLNKCNIYNRTEAGDLLREVLRLGNSEHWKTVMLKLTKETSSLSSRPLLEYFQPLSKWLEKQNQGEFIGWKSDDPMSCPSANKN